MTSSQPVPSSADAQFAAWQQDVEERLRALATAPRITSTSQRGGAYELLDEDGNKLFTFGEYTRGAFTDYGIQSLVPDGGGPGFNSTALEININGMEAPQIPLHVQKADEFVVVTNAAFQIVFNAASSLLVSDSVQWFSVISTDVGTTAEARFGSSGVYTDVIPCSAGVQTLIDFRWQHGFVQGGNRIFHFEVRRTGGTGNVNVYSPIFVSQVGSAGSGAVPDGVV